MNDVNTVESMPTEDDLKTAKTSKTNKNNKNNKSDLKKKSIVIRCNYNKLLQVDELIFTQGALKHATKENMRKLKNSIITNGFVFPIYVWENAGKYYVIGGHHRVKALKELLEKSYTIEGVPCVLIHANNIKEAKKFVLLDSAQYAKIDKKEFGDFVLDADIDLDTILNEIANKEIELADIFKIEFPVDYNQGRNAIAPKIPAVVVAFALTAEQARKVKDKLGDLLISEAIKDYVLKQLCSENISANS